MIGEIQRRLSRCDIGTVRLVFLYLGQYLGCVFETWSYHQELLFATLWPAAVMGSLLLLGHACGGAAVRERTEYLALFISFLVFPRTSVVVFAAFRCDEVEMGAGAASTSTASGSASCAQNISIMVSGCELDARPPSSSTTTANLF